MSARNLAQREAEKHAQKVSNKDIKREIKTQIGQSVKAYSKLDAPFLAKPSRSMLKVKKNHDSNPDNMALKKKLSSSTLKTLDPAKSDTNDRHTAILFKISEEQQNRGQKKGATSRVRATEPDDRMKIPID